MARKITWTPEGSENYLGTVRVPGTLETLTRQQYQDLLKDRLDRLVRAEIQEGRDPVAMAEPLMWEWDQLTPAQNPSNLAQLLAMESETLHNKTMGRATFPMKVAQMKQDEEAMMSIREETLMDYLNSLYQ